MGSEAVFVRKIRNCIGITAPCNDIAANYVNDCIIELTVRIYACVCLCEALEIPHVGNHAKL